MPKSKNNFTNPETERILITKALGSSVVKSLAEKIVLLTILGCVIVGFFFVAYKKNDQKEIIKVTQEWAGVLPFPENATIVSVDKKGSSFSREFHVVFRASEKDIRQWLRNSNGTLGITPEVEGDIETYSLQPKEGAQFAEVMYNTATGEVSITVHWS